MLSLYGWSDALQQDFTPFAAQGLVPARVTVQQRGRFRLITEQGETESRISGRFAHEAHEGDYPVTGDWVAVELKADVAVIQHVLPRTTVFTRKAAGPSGAVQVVAANVDVALLAALAERRPQPAPAGALSRHGAGKRRGTGHRPHQGRRLRRRRTPGR